jgi:hypothetical protein
MSIIFHCTVPNFVCLSETVHELSPYDNIFNFQRPVMFVNVFMVSQKVVLLKVVHPLNIYQNTTFSWTCVDWSKSCIHLSSTKFPPSPYSKGPPKKIITQTKLVGMSTILHCTKLRMSKRSSS